MRILVFIAFVLIICQSCSKTNTTPPDTIPPIVDTPNLPTSLYNPVPLDTINDWIRIGRVSSGLEDIWFNTNTDGFLVTENDLLATRDGGTTWAKIPNTDNQLLYNMQFLNSQNGFVQGSSKLGITNDGGVTWFFKTLPSNSGFYFQFISSTTGFYNDLTLGLKKTTDAGNLWTTVLPSGQRNFPFYFLDSLKGFSMANGDFNTTTDGGSNWTLKTAKVTTYHDGYYKMQFPDPSNGYCATPKGLAKTTDGGGIWTICLADSTKFMIPYFIDANNGYCLNENSIYKTTDGGQNWKLSCKLTTDRFSGLHFLDMNTGWASTFGGYFLKLK